MGTVGQSMNEGGYKNWFKVAFGLNCVKLGLCSFTLQVIDEFQQELLRSNNIKQPKICTSCNQDNIKDCKLKQRCPNGMCDKLLVAIVNEHINRKTIVWQNCDIRQWSVKSWEIAKVYMSRGQRSTNTRPNDTDCAGLLQLVNKCRRFRRNHNIPPDIVDQVINLRNSLMHSANMSIDESTVIGYIDKMINFLEKIQKNSNSVQVQQELDNLRELKDTHVNIRVVGNGEISDQDKITNLKNGFDETDSTQQAKDMQVVGNGEISSLLQEKMIDLKERLDETDSSQQSDLQAEAVSLMRFFETFPDFMNCTELGDQLQDVLEVIKDVVARTKRTEHRVETVETQMATLTSEQQDILCRIERLEQKTNTVAGPNYKGMLQYFVQGLGLTLPDYIYEPAAMVDSSNGFKSSVRVNGRMFTCDEVFARKIQAAQNVAHIALEQLQLDATLSSPLTAATAAASATAAGEDFVTTVTDRFNRTLTTANNTCALAVASSSNNSGINSLMSVDIHSCCLQFTNTTSYYDLLQSVCHCTQLTEPRMSVTSLKVSITLVVPFRSTVGCQSKKEADELAATLALSVLEPPITVPSLTGVISTDGKNARTRLKEFCDRQQLPSKPEYETLGNCGQFFSAVLVHVLEQCPITAVDTETIATNIAARKLLDKLQLIPNICRLYDATYLESFDCCSKSNQQGALFTAKLSAVYVFEADTSQPGYKSKKEADKCAAHCILRQLVPDVHVPVFDLVKNKLQELDIVSKPPEYLPFQFNGSFYSRVKVPFELTETGSDAVEASEAVARSALQHTRSK